MEKQENMKTKKIIQIRISFGLKKVQINIETYSYEYFKGCGYVLILVLL